MLYKGHFGHEFNFFLFSKQLNARERIFPIFPVLLILGLEAIQITIYY